MDKCYKKSFIENKIKYKLFDNVITGWKVNGRVNEPKRSSYMKLLSDFKKLLDVQIKTKLYF